MKRVLIANDIRDLFTGNNSFLDREDIAVFVAATNDDILKIHREERVDVIITQLDMPGIKTEDLFNIIRGSKEVRSVSTIILCKDTLAHRERCKQCTPNVVFTIPVDTALLHMKVQELLNVAPRKFYRAALAVGIQGKFKNQPLQFRTENISASGMLIKAEEPLAKGDGIFFSFFLPDGTHVSGYGEIARAVQLSTILNTFFYGIKFTNLDEDTKSAIETTVKKSIRPSGH
jgi:response regulator RpfG family c-di-GMP phosphodiesterase